MFYAPKMADMVTIEAPFKANLFRYVWNDEQRKLAALLKKDCQLIDSIDDTYHSGFSPLLVAAMNGRLSCMKLLVRHGANLRHRDAAGRNALHWAASRGYLNVAQYLINECSFDPLETSNKGYTPVDMARRSGQTKVYDFLINIVAGYDGGHTPVVDGVA